VKIRENPWFPSSSVFNDIFLTTMSLTGTRQYGSMTLSTPESFAGLDKAGGLAGRQTNEATFYEPTKEL